MKLRQLVPLLAASVALPLLSAHSQTPPPAAAPTAEGGQKPPRGNPAEMAQKRLDFMKENLGLSAEQTEKIAAIQKEQLPAFQAIRADTALSKEQKREKMKTLHTSTDAKISEVLTADQKTKWEVQKAAMKEKMKQQHEKGGAPGTPPAAPAK